MIRLGFASVHRKLILSMMTVGGITAGVKLAAAGRDLVLAHQFGTRGELDAYLIAYALPAFATNLIAGSLSATFIPLLVEVKLCDGHASARALFAATLGRVALLLAAVTVLLAIATPRLVAVLTVGFTPELAALTVKLTRILLPTLWFGGLATTFGAVLNASGRFARVATAPLLTPVLQLALVLNTSGSRIEMLAYGTAGGALVEASILYWALRNHGYWVVPQWNGLGRTQAVFRRQYLAIAVGSVLMGSTTLVDQAMAATLGSGSVSALAYGTKLVAVIREIGPTAMSTVLLPHFASLTASRDWGTLRRHLGFYTRVILALSIPATLVLAVLSKFIIRLLFERGAFTPADTEQVTSIQILFGLQIPFYMLGLMFVRVISALQANQILMYGTAISVLVNIGLNYALMKPLGVGGIALSTSGVYLVSYIYLAFLASRLLKRAVQSTAENASTPRERSLVALP
jgi:putative peptidoglycan lipid II flippase